MAKKLKVGIIGMGTIGPVHADAYKLSGQAQIAAICDIDPKKLAARGEEFGVPLRLENYRDLLATDIDAVSICVPNYLHMEMATAALKAGKHVLLEKPMAMNAAQAQKIADAAKKSRRVLQIGMCCRQGGDVQTLREYVEAGTLGNIYHLRAVSIRRRGIPGMGGWFTTKAQSGGGPMIDIGVHVMDVALYVSDLWKPTAVSANTYAKFGPRMKGYCYVSMWAGPPKFEGRFDVEDYATGLVRFGSKATMSFEIAWAANAREESFVEVLGDKGGARVMDGKPLEIYTEDHGHVANLSPQYAGTGHNHHVQGRKFLEACRGECKPAATGEQGVVFMKILDAIYKSSAQGKEVAIR